MTFGQHAIRCKKTGKAIGMLLDGGECACPSADQCRERKGETLPEFIDRVVDGEEARRELMRKFDDTFREVIANAGKMTLAAVAAERERCVSLVMALQTLPEFLARVVNGEEARREVAQKFEATYRDVIETMTKTRDMLIDVMEQRDKAVALAESLLEIGPVAAERERCAKRCDGLAIATKITGGGEWNEAQRAAVTTATEWLAREIRNGEQGP